MMINSYVKETQAYAQDGYCVVTLANKDGVHAIQSLLLNELRKEISAEISLESYHLFVTDEEHHKNIQYRLFNLLSESALHFRLAEDNLDLYREFFGHDIDVQIRPFVRIARPNCQQDNIGFHYDTFYGGSAFEVSCVFPLTQNTEEGVLRISPGSHKWPLPSVDQVPSETVEKGSFQSEMGFLYAPKTIRDMRHDLNVPVMARPGDSIIFSLGLLHGQEVNRDDICRWSIDFRLRNAYAPMSKNMKSGFYQSLHRSAISTVAAEYYSDKSEEKSLLNANF